MLDPLTSSSRDHNTCHQRTHAHTRLSAHTVRPTSQDIGQARGIVLNVGRTSMLWNMQSVAFLPAATVHTPTTHSARCHHGIAVQPRMPDRV